MGLLNALGMVGAGAGEGYGKGTSAVGTMTLDSLLKEAQAMKEDSLARARQGDQNIYNAAESQKEREARSSEAKDTRQFQTEMKGIELEEQAKSEADRRKWQEEQDKIKFNREAGESAKERAAREKIATGKTDAKDDKDNAFTNLPAVIKDRFTEYKFDENGFKIGEAINPEFSDFNLFWRKSGIKSPYDAMAAFDEAKKTETPPLMFDITGANLGKKGSLGPVGGKQEQTAQPQGRRVKLKNGVTGTYNDTTGEFYPDPKP